jgi:hypothetical protein
LMIVASFSPTIAFGTMLFRQWAERETSGKFGSNGRALVIDAVNVDVAKSGWLEFGVIGHPRLGRVTGHVLFSFTEDRVSRGDPGAA